MKTLLTSLAILSTLLVFSPVHAELDLVGIGSIRFVQEGPDGSEDITGDWTLIRPGNERTEGVEKEFDFKELDAGVYVFSTKLPEGTSVVIDVLLDGKKIDTIDRPQVTIPLDGQESYLLKLKYTFSNAGTVAVNSSPPGLRYTLQGPNGMILLDETPNSYHNVPIGQYSATFDVIEGCPSMPPQSDRLVKDSRITLSVEVVCDNLEHTEIGQNDQKTYEFVTVTIEGKQVTFEDVKTEAWFAPYIAKVAKAGITSGYKDRSGNPTGAFGPGDNVTIAQLAKFAHEFAGIDETKARGDVQNTRARNQWFEQYFASAEQNWWEVWRDKRLDPSRPATRAEVLVTVLRALNVPRIWAQGKTFADIQPTDAYASSIETAAMDGLIDSGGYFRPRDPINRAEMAKILANAMDIYIKDTAEQNGDSR